MKKQFIPDNYMELFFGVGAAVVIIGALLKIINASLIFSANTWLIAGLSTEAIIFTLSGIQGYFLSSPGAEEEDAVSTIAVETAALQKAVDGTVKGLNSLNANLSSASKAAQSISVPSDLSSNAQSVSDGLSLASSSIEEINKLYQNLGKSLSQVNSATNALDIPEGIGEELEKMKNTIKELNAKYEAMLGAMNK
ncbi:MAG: gliding motility protein GldL [Flavobacteriaceae bacterium]|jgi:methyl-accepting chemotaxis protein|nr:MAG: gliding motility protein GldL [Flavobacteriaceae bacterium]